jgi:hypothetical protein
MTNEERTNYTRMGLAIVGIQIDETTSELVWKMCEGIKRKKGNFSIKDAVQIEYEVKGKIEKKRIIAETVDQGENPDVSDTTGDPSSNTVDNQ